MVMQLKGSRYWFNDRVQNKIKKHHRNQGEIHEYYPSVSLSSIFSRKDILRIM